MPVPVVLLCSPAPAGSILILAVSYRRAHGHRNRAHAPHYIAVIALWLLVAHEVDVAAPGVKPGPSQQLNPAPPVAALEGVPQTSLADIVDGRPHKVAYDVGVLLREAPVARDGVGIGLRAVHDALRELLVVALVAALLVVVAAHLDEVEGAWRVLVPRHLLRRAVPVVVHS